MPILCYSNVHVHIFTWLKKWRAQDNMSSNRRRVIWVVWYSFSTRHISTRTVFYLALYSIHFGHACKLVTEYLCNSLFLFQLQFIFNSLAIQDKLSGKQQRIIQLDESLFSKSNNFSFNWRHTLHRLANWFVRQPGVNRAFYHQINASIAS